MVDPANDAGLDSRLAEMAGTVLPHKPSEAAHSLNSFAPF
jgi:hypothetical protein